VRHKRKGTVGLALRAAILMVGVVCAAAPGCGTSAPDPLVLATAPPTAAVSPQSAATTPSTAPTFGSFGTSQLGTPTVVPATPQSPTAVSSASPLRGTVLQRSNCRYGPDWPYLYKYGLAPGIGMEVIGRDADGDWLQVQAVSGHNPCWIKSVQVRVDGDVMRLPDAYAATNLLPISPFFQRVTITRTSQSGRTVTVDWAEHHIRGRAETGEGVEYVIEVWTCVGGKPNFSAYGFPPGETSFSFQVDNSCGISSHADLVGEDKEGFSLPAEIPVR
jgi:hypothetical protein